jgi:hypothetical protein
MWSGLDVSTIGSSEGETWLFSLGKHEVVETYDEALRFDAGVGDDSLEYYDLFCPQCVLM